MTLPELPFPSFPAAWSVGMIAGAPGGEGPGMSETEREWARPRGASTHTSPSWPRGHRSPPSRGTHKESKAKTHGQGGAEARDSLLPSFPDHCDPLTVFCPSNVLDLPSERLILIL